MSINTITLSPSRTPTPLQDELVFVKVVENIEYTLTDSSRNFQGLGNVFLTDLRMILVADKPTEAPEEAFSTLTVPLTSVLICTPVPPRLLSQPRIQFEIKPTPGGGLRDATFNLQIQFSRSGKEAFLGFVGAFEKTCERAVAVAKSRANPEEELDLPAYSDTGPASSSSADFAGSTTVPYDAPPGYDT